MLNVRLRSECDVTGLNVSLQVEMGKEIPLSSFSDLLEHKWVGMESLNLSLHT